MKRCLLLFVLLLTIINWIHAKNEAHGATFTVELAEQDEGPYNEEFEIDITFSVKVSKDIIAADDFTFTGDGEATVTITSSGTKKKHTATITPTSSGELTIQIETGAITKGSGDTNEASNSLTVTIDRDAPTVTFEDLPSDTPTEAFDIIVEFNEDVTGFDDKVNDITLGGTAAATVTEITEDDEDEYTVTITPTTAGTVTVKVPAGAAEDTAGNGNTESDTSDEITVDPEPPTVTLSGKPSGPQNGDFDITITFSEDVTGFDDADVTFGGTATATADVSGSGKDYTATITPTASGNLTIKVEADAAEDTAENGNEASTNTLTVPIDVDDPTVTLSGVPTAPRNGDFDITITFNENVTGFTADDIDLDDEAASATLTGSGKDYTATITPSADGTLTISVPADAAEDDAGNGNTESSEETVTIDKTKPTVTGISEPSGEQKDPFTITVTFSEAVNGFTTGGLTVTGEAKATAVSGSDGDTEWTVTITPNDDKEDDDVTVKVNANAVTDNAGNGNTASTPTGNIHIDTEEPTVTISTPPNDEQNDTFDLTITFSETVTGFAVPGDLTVVGEAVASLKNTVTPDKVYTVTITPNPNKEGDVTVKVNADTVTDAAGNNNTASAVTPAVHIDTKAPTISSITGPSGEQKAAFDITITFSEDVSGFVLADDLTLTGPATAAFKTTSEGPKAYDVTITPTDDSEGDVTVRVKADAVTDAAGNKNTISTVHTVHIDNIAPTVSIGGLPSGEQKDPFTITVTFSEAMKNFVAGDVTVTGKATATGISANTEKSVYTVTITPNATSEGDVTFKIAASVATDNAGNNNTASTVTTAIHIDTIVPTVTISTPPITEQNGTFDLTITFSEEVDGFAVPADLTVTGEATASLKATVTAKTVFTVTITPKDNKEGKVTVKVNANAATDPANNGNTASAATPQVHIDTIAPTVTITGVPTIEKNVAFDLTITFSEDVNGFAVADDLTLEGEATVSLKATVTANKVYKVTITPKPAKEDDVFLQVKANAVTDAAGNNNTASAKTTAIHIDNIAPTVSIGGLPSGEQKDPFTITVTFSEAMKNFVAGDVTVTGKATATGISANTEKSVYTVTITPNTTSEGDVTFKIAANVATDNALNNNTASTVTTAIHIDTIVPTVTISIPPITEQNGPFDLTITFSEEVDGFAVPGDLTVTGPATASLKATVTAKTVFTVTITPNATSEGDVTVKVNADAVTDAARNNNTASAVTPQVHIDTIAPTVTITSLPAIEKNVAFDITITFLEPVNGFTASDLGDLVHATAAVKSGADRDSVYVVTITPNANAEGDVTLQVPANTVKDFALNNNTASTPHTVHIDTIPPTVSIGGLPSGEQKDPFTITVTFSEAMKNFAVGDVTVTGKATATGISANTEKSVYTVTITPNATSEGDVTFKIAANVATDNAGNNNTASTVTTPIHIDTIVPTVTISTPPTTEQNSAFDLTITFSEEVAGFVSPDDLTVTGPATASSATTVTPKTVFTVTITPNATSEGKVTVKVNANAATDPANNGNTASAVTPQVHIDTIVPTVEITDVPTIEKNVPFDITITFNEAVNGFTASDLGDLVHATAAVKPGADGSSTYEVTITPNATVEGTVTLQVPANTVKDFALNNNTASTAHTVHIDTIVPTVAITDVPTIEKNVPFDLTVTFSEPVNGFTTADVVVPGEATATAVGGGDGDTVYTVTITPNAGQEDDVTVQVSANTVQDFALNDNTASAVTPQVHIDTIVPTVEITGEPTIEKNVPFDLTVTFSEPVNGFAAGDVAVTGPAAPTVTAGSDGDDVYTVTITPNPTSEDDVTVQVSANTVKDFALNNNTASDVTPKVHIDTIVPTVAITQVPTEIQYESFLVRIEFLEDVTEFELADIEFSGEAVVEDAVLTPDSEQVYTLEITPHEDTDGDLIITVPADVAIDAALNNNVVSAPRAVPVAPLWIPDPNLRVAVRAELGLAEGEDFSRTELSLLNTFVAAAPQIIDLTGFEYAINLTRLDLSGNAITDITALETLTDLTALNLNDNNIGFIAPLEDMTALTVLELKGNSVADLNSLAGLTQLKTLNLRENAVVDVTPLAELTMLNHLDLTTNRIRDVAPLLALKNLVTLRLSGNPILTPDILVGLAETIEIEGTLPDLTPDPGLSSTLRTLLGVDPSKQITEAHLKGRKTLEVEASGIKDLSGLERATDLTTLVLSDNAITDITPLQGLTELTTLNLGGNNTKDITPLRELTQLTTLDLSGNAVTDITPLRGLTELKVLNLGGNAITDITPLRGLTQLTTLNLAGNKITDITLLPTFTQLTRLNISNNPIGNLAPLAALTRLTTLELSGHALSDLDIISGLTRLLTLNLSDNAITSSSLDAIAGLTALVHLDLSKNRVTDVTPLARFTRLTTLDASYNNISDVQPLAALTSLNHLYLTTNNIRDVQPLAGLVNLRTLRLAENAILNTAPLYPLTQRASPVDSDIVITQYPPWDVNEDGKVDAADSALVTAALGQSGGDIAEPRTDVNGDGTVDNADLLLVTEHLEGNVGAAPAAMDIFTGLDRATLETLDRATLKATLDRLLVESDGSLKYLRAIKLLQNLLAVLLPDETRLFANYPNPFNPETWIPYQLAKGGTVEIFIYDTRGILVRHLALGHQRAGYYTEKSRAAYWDGRNRVGERVASGIYFYQLRAADASLLRKMLILK